MGPQYPLIYMSTTFEPDSAFLLKKGEFYSQLSYILLNTYVFSNNSDKYNNPGGDSTIFNNINDTTGYSIYFDGEINRRFSRIHYGYSENLEIHLTYRELRFINGNLDTTIESFHKMLGIGNQSRGNTDINLLEVYVYNNKTGEVVFKVTNESKKFHQESITFGFKYGLKETKDEALSFTISTNFNDQYIESGINEIASTSATDHKNFNDYSFSLHYSSIFPDWTLYAAFSKASLGNSLFVEAPNELYYFFLGANWHLNENWDWLVQALEYSSPYPEDNVSFINADILEVFSAFRWLVNESFTMEMGLIENQSQGPQNIDIAFFSTFMLSF